jgi:tetratricopeptide (TPR) repeat protein
MPNGIGIPCDAATALSWYQKSAQKGNSKALVAIGFHYLSGNGVATNTSESLVYFQRAVELGNSDGLIGIGCYYQDINKPKEARKYYKLAIEQGNENATKVLAAIDYERGIGRAEFVRTCNQCGKVWRSSIDNEKRLRGGFIKYTLRYAIFGDNASLMNQLDRDKLQNSYRCPNCGSINYTEDIEYFN